MDAVVALLAGIVVETDDKGINFQAGDCSCTHLAIDSYGLCGTNRPCLLYTSIESTDAEERYIKSDWYFDSNLYLYRIEIPGSEVGRPAKILSLIHISGQSILILHCGLELTDSEIGAVVGMSRSAVQRHRTKTLETMRTRLTGGIAE